MLMQVLVLRTGTTHLATPTTTSVSVPSVTISFIRKVSYDPLVDCKLWSATLKPSSENTLLGSENDE